MKTKIYLFAAIATVGMLFSSCDKKDLDSKSTLHFSISGIGTPGTRAIDDLAIAGDAGTEISTLQVLAIGTGNVVLQTFNLSPTEITAARSGSGHKIPNFPDAAGTVEVKANYGSGALYQDIKDLQGITAKKLPLSGTGPVVPSTTTTGEKQAAVTINRAVARIELVGGIAVSNPTTPPPPPAFSNGVHKVNIKNIYINRFKVNITDLDPTTEVNDGVSTWASTTLFTTNNMTDQILGITANEGTYGQSIGIVPNKAAAYHVFAGSLPQVVIEVEVWETATSAAPLQGVKFININKFKNGGAQVLTFDANQVYKINLDDLAKTFKLAPGHPSPGTEDPLYPPVTPTDPVPNAQNVGMTINVTVTNWTINEITPDFS